MNWRREQIRLLLRDVWVAQHNDRIDTRVTAHHGVSLLQPFQEWINIPKQQLSDCPLLYKPTKSNLNSHELHKGFQ
jgi:hypothetical protein